MEQKLTTPITKGIIITLILIAITLCSTFLTTTPNAAFQWVGYIIFIGGVILSVWIYGKEIQHQSTFGNYFAHGFKTGAVVTCLMIVFLVIFMNIFPEFKERALEEARKGMERRNASEEQVDKAFEFTKKFFTVFMIGGALVIYLFLAAVSALVGAAITKKNPDTYHHDINQTGG